MLPGFASQVATHHVHASGGPTRHDHDRGNPMLMPRQPRERLTALMMAILGDALMVLTPLRPGQDVAGRLGHRRDQPP
jgi:hypothetical protein